MRIPSEQEIKQLQKEFDVLPIVNEHLEKCKEKAVIIAQRILRTGKIKAVDLKLVELGARLHDLAKPATIENLTPEKFGSPPATSEQIRKWKAVRAKYPTKGHELEVMAKIMRQRGYIEFGNYLLTLG